jgi:hypothetical protein
LAGGGDCATCCAIAGKAIATAAEATSIGLMRIAPLRHCDFDRVRRPGLRHGRKIEQGAKDEHENDDQYNQS